MNKMLKIAIYIVGAIVGLIAATLIIYYSANVLGNKIAVANEVEVQQQVDRAPPTPEEVFNSLDPYNQVQIIRNFNLSWPLVSRVNRRMSDDEKVWFISCMLGYAEDQMNSREVHQAAPYDILRTINNVGGLESPYCQSRGTITLVPLFMYVKENYSDYKSPKKEKL